MKTKYEEPYLEVIACDSVDIITTSDGTGVPWDDDWTDALEQF